MWPFITWGAEISFEICGGKIKKKKKIRAKTLGLGMLEKLGLPSGFFIYYFLMMRINCTDIWAKVDDTAFCSMTQAHSAIPPHPPTLAFPSQALESRLAFPLPAVSGLGLRTQWVNPQYSMTATVRRRRTPRCSSSTWCSGETWLTQACHASVCAVWFHKDDPHTVEYCSPQNIDEVLGNEEEVFFFFSNK